MWLTCKKAAFQNLTESQHIHRNHIKCQVLSGNALIILGVQQNGVHGQVSTDAGKWK